MGKDKRETGREAEKEREKQVPVWMMMLMQR